MTFFPERCRLWVPNMRRALAPAVLLALVSFSLGGTPIRLDVPPGLQPAWERLVFRHPLPQDLSSGSIILREGRQAGFRVVESAVLVPVIRMWETPVTLTRAQAESGGVRLRPLDSVELPDIALPVDGLFPGDSGYPLVKLISVGIGDDDAALRAWFESLPDLPVGGDVERILWIGAVGDVMPARGVDAALIAPDGLRRVFGDVLPVLQGFDFLAGNLEAAATTGGTRAVKSYTFRFDPRALARLSAAGFSYLSAANNHTFDFGSRGFLDTLENLEHAGIATSGAGSTAAGASRPAVLRIGATEVRLLSFAAYPADRTGFDGRIIARAGADRPGELWLDDDGIAAAARAFSPDAFNIALVHGGVEWSTIPTEDQKRRYRDLVRAGADLVIGSHPHLLQGLEARDGRLIAYSLGNFLFPGMDGTPGGERSLVLAVGIFGRRIVSLRTVAVRLSAGTVRRDQRPGALQEFRSLTGRLNGGVPRNDASGVQWTESKRSGE